MRKLTFTLLAIALPLPLLANPALEGDWMLELKPDGAALIGVLQLERDGAEWNAYVEGGPAPVEINGDSIEVAIDSRDIRGFVFVMRLSGTLTGERLEGTFTVESEARVNVSDGTWSGVPHVLDDANRMTKPDDILGIWKPSPGVDLRKYTMDLTPAADAWLSEYMMHYDQPNVRCASPGITAMVAWGGYPFEILKSPDRLTFIYEFDSEVRRIFMDDREPPEFYQASGMGFSNGRWENGQLIIETQLLAQNVRDFRGEPISENARLEEIYYLTDDGNTLNAVVTLHDPDNYQRPPVRRRQWTQDPNTAMYPSECDPDSFYRQMYNENLLDMYFERSNRRF